MGDMADAFREVRAARKARRAEHGRPCPECLKRYPKRDPSLLLPQQVCKVDGYRDPRPVL